jgi:hypothetical protein
MCAALRTYAQLSDGFPIALTDEMVNLMPWHDARVAMYNDIFEPSRGVGMTAQRCMRTQMGPAQLCLGRRQRVHCED